jgi:hypothetical protein
MVFAMTTQKPYIARPGYPAQQAAVKTGSQSDSEITNELQRLSKTTGIQEAKLNQILANIETGRDRKHILHRMHLAATVLDLFRICLEFLKYFLFSR